MRIIKGLAWLVVGVLLVLGLMYAWGRLRPPTAEQARALSLLQQDLKPSHGSNAFHRLWFGDFDIPDDRLDAAYAQELPRAREWVAAHGKTSDQLMPAPTPDFPALPTMTKAERELTCRARETHCLEKIRAHRDEVRDVLARHRERLAQDEALAGDDYLWSDMPAHPLVFIPRYGADVGLWSTAIALDFIDGRHQEAMEQACTQVHAMRRLHAHSNTLIGTMVMAGRVQGATHLFAELLADMPPDEAVPDRCRQAFAPVQADDVSLCASAQGEYAFLQGILGASYDDRWYHQIAWNLRNTSRQQARNYGELCEPTVTEQALRDQHITLTPPTAHADVFDRVSNPVGTILVSISGGMFDDYLARQQDMVATLRMGATLLWLHDARNAAEPLQERIEQRPAWMHVDASRALRISPDARTITLSLHNRHKSEPAEWPLPVGL